MGLIATQIQRELIDLARKHAGPMSYAQNHDTNVRPIADGGAYLVEEAAESWMAAEHESRERAAEEIAQLLYHTQVLMLSREISLADVYERL